MFLQAFRMLFEAGTNCCGLFLQAFAASAFFCGLFACIFCGGDKFLRGLRKLFAALAYICTLSRRRHVFACFSHAF
jgi:hypothetical protein